MNNRIVNLITLVALFNLSLLAQKPKFLSITNNGLIGSLTNMPTNAIADDFGPRDLSDFFHAGVDFNCAQGDGNGDKWYPMISPQAGIIADFDQLTRATDFYKYGLVNIKDSQGNGSHTLLFGHVFDWTSQFYDVLNQSIYLNRCEFPNTNKWGLHLRLITATGDTLRYTYGQIAGATLKVNGVDYITTNIINTSDPFLPLGNSGGSSSS